MIEINRWAKDSENMLIPNDLFSDILRDGKKVCRLPLLECPGRYEGCYIYKSKVYENWVNWGFDCLYLLEQSDII